MDALIRAHAALDPSQVQRYVFTTLNKPPLKRGKMDSQKQNCIDAEPLLSGDFFSV